LKTKDTNLAISTPPFFPHFWQLKTSEITSLLILKFLIFSFWRNLASLKKKLLVQVGPVSFLLAKVVIIHS